MRFKDWLQKDEMVGTPVLNGGIGESPNDNLNVNMPVRSKISTNDGAPPREETLPAGKKPEEVFGFRNRRDRKNARERASQTLDMGKRFPLNTNNPASIGLSN